MEVLHPVSLEEMAELNGIWHALACRRKRTQRLLLLAGLLASCGLVAVGLLLPPLRLGGFTL
jgi:hypothetical protein